MRVLKNGIVSFTQREYSELTRESQVLKRAPRTARYVGTYFGNLGSWHVLLVKKSMVVVAAK